MRKNRQITKTTEKNTEWKWETEQQNDFETIKKVLTEEPALAQYAEDKDNIVTTDASKTGLGITLWQKQADGELKPMEFGSSFLNDIEKNYSTGEVELLAVVWGLENSVFINTGKGVSIY